MVGFVHYPEDGRVRREAEGVAAAGARVDVICLRRPGQAAHEVVDGVRVHRLGVSRRRRGRLRYLAEYGIFAARAGLAVTALGRRRRPDVVHVHNPPDLLAYCAIGVRSAGARVILDVHDVLPELYMRRYGLAATSPGVRLVRWAERRAARFADHVLVASPLMRERLLARAVEPDRCTTILNLPDPRWFSCDGPVAPRSAERFRVVYPGTLAEVQGVDLAVRAMHWARTHAGVPLELHVYGNGSERYVASLRALTRELGLESAVLFHESVTGAEYARMLRSMDAGVVPKRAGTFAELAMSTKLLEFAAVGLPAAVARTTPETLYFDDTMVAYFEPGNMRDLGETLVRLARDAGHRAELARRGQTLFTRVNWPSEREKLVDVYSRLLSKR
jgi:glycosyltransferase involved in cell wall biosynthesis